MRFSAGLGTAEVNASATVFRLTLYGNASVLPDTPSLESLRIAANNSILDIRGIGLPNRRIHSIEDLAGRLANSRMKSSSRATCPIRPGGRCEPARWAG